MINIFVGPTNTVRYLDCILTCSVFSGPEVLGPVVRAGQPAERAHERGGPHPRPRQLPHPGGEAVRPRVPRQDQAGAGQHQRQGDQVRL